MKKKTKFNTKKANLYKSRIIKTQITDKSFVNKEKLNVPDFLESRKFEIESFELSQLNTKYASSKRIFQKLPRSLRRRSASHNLKRIPKRLRNKALREIINSTNGKNEKKKVSNGKKLYKLKRTKRLHILAGKLKVLKEFPDSKIFEKNIKTRYKIQLLNEQIKEIMKSRSESTFNNILYSHDNTGINQLSKHVKCNLKFHKRQTHFKWIPTHVWHAKRFHMVKQYTFQMPLIPTQKCFRLMNRCSRKSAVLFDVSYYTTLILEIPEKNDFFFFLSSLIQKNDVFIHSNENKFFYNWIHSLKTGEKIGKAYIFFNIEINRIIIRVFPSIYENLFNEIKEFISKFQNSNVYDCKYSIGSFKLIGPEVIYNLSKIFHFFSDENSKIIDFFCKLSNVNDSNIVPDGTTLCFDVKDPRLWKHLTNELTKKKFSNSDSINIILDIVSNRTDFINKKSLLNFLTIDGRNDSYKNQLSIKDISKHFEKSSQCSVFLKNLTEVSKIPLILSKINKSEWLMLIPWHWVLPLWLLLVKKTRVSVGGLKQQHQFNLEKKLPSFPQDFPFLQDGWNYNELIGKLNFQKFEKLPLNQKNKYVSNNDDLELITPFKCDWIALRSFFFLKKFADFNTNKLVYAKFSDQNLNRKIENYNDLNQVVKTINKMSSDEKTIPLVLYDKKNLDHQKIIKNDYKLDNFNEIINLKIPVIQIYITILNKGLIKDYAKIFYFNNSSDLINKNHNQTNLVGFVTSCNLNLNLGRSCGIGVVCSSLISKQNFVYIKNIKSTNFHLAKFEII